MPIYQRFKIYYQCRGLFTGGQFHSIHEREKGALPLFLLCRKVVCSSEVLAIWVNIWDLEEYPCREVIYLRGWFIRGWFYYSCVYQYQPVFVYRWYVCKARHCNVFWSSCCLYVRWIGFIWSISSL